MGVGVETAIGDVQLKEWQCMTDGCAFVYDGYKCSDEELLADLGVPYTLDECKTECENYDGCNFIWHSGNEDGCWLYDTCETLIDADNSGKRHGLVGTDWWCLGDCTASATMNKCSDGEMLTRVGKNTSLEDCQAYCESETSCKFIAHAQDADSRCFTYSSCDTRQDSNQDVIVYEYVSRGVCTYPGTAWTSNSGYNCNGDCINDNIGYDTVEEAWDKCVELASDCHFLMLDSADNKIYLRKLTDHPTSENSEGSSSMEVSCTQQATTYELLAAGVPCDSANIITTEEECTEAINSLVSEGVTDYNGNVIDYGNLHDMNSPLVQSGCVVYVDMYANFFNSNVHANGKSGWQVICIATSSSEQSVAGSETIVETSWGFWSGFVLSILMFLSWTLAKQYYVGDKDKKVLFISKNVAAYTQLDNLE